MRTHEQGRWVPVGLALALALPSLWAGLQFDDYPQRALLRGAAGPLGHAAASPAAAMLGLFTFLDGDAAHARAAMDSGALPWWTLPTASQSFWRPLAAMTHWLDNALWPDDPWRMHAHSLLWFAALVAAAGALYRRVLSGADPAAARTAAGLAALLYAVDDAHGFAVGWLANRNALMAALFGVLCLHSHVRWRRDGRRIDAIAAPMWLALGLLSAEAAVATLAYLAAYAICLDGGGWRRRLAALLPSLTVLAVWASAYRMLGFGAWGTAYVDPVGEPLGFVRAVALRGPILLLGQWALPPAEVSAFLGPAARVGLWVAAVLVLAGLMWLLVPTLRRSASARFWGTGMLLAVIPSCAALPANRLLLFVGLGAMGLLAELLTDVRSVARRTLDDVAVGPRRPAGARARVTRAGAGALVAVHLGLAPLLLPIASLSPALLGGGARAALSLPAAAAPVAAAQTDVIVSAPSFFSAGLVRTIRADHGLTTPARVRYLGAGSAALDMTRLDAWTLVARPVGGYLSGFDPLFRGQDHPLAVGEAIDLAGMTATVSRLTPDGRPAEVGFRFAVPLEDPSLRWFAWRDGVFVPFTLPAVGAARRVPAVLPLRLARAPSGR